MRKRLLTLVVAMFTLTTFARDIVYTYEGQTLTYTVVSEEARTVMTSYGNDVSGSLVIPSQIKDDDGIYTVISIGDWTFRDCAALTSVTIPESVTSIGENTFDGCIGLTSVTIPSSVTSIGSGAFYNCSGLTSISIPNSVTSIGSCAFGDCSGLTSVTIPNSVTSIESSVFMDCRGLTSVTIPNSITSIGDQAFSGCTGLSSIIIPNSVTTIGDRAFRDCAALTSFTFPESVSEINEEIFQYCSGLTSITIPESVTHIGKFAFHGCVRLPSITIPESVTHIGNYAFSCCTSLTSFIIPESVISIGGGAFSYCYGLSAVILRRSPIAFHSIEMSSSEFSYCNDFLKCAYPDNMENPFPSEVYATAYDFRNISINGNTIYGQDGKSILFVPFNDKGDYSVPSSVTEIGKEAYRYLGNMNTIEIHDDVTAIGDNAFADCQMLETVILPMKLKTLGSAVFANSSSIKDVVYNGLSPVESTADVFDSKVYEDGTLYVCSGRQTLFTTVSPWKFFRNITDEVYSGIGNVATDFGINARCEIYNLNGVKVSDNVNNLAAGIYIRIANGKLEKFIVR
ncbi:MAG: leucine-rich repeat domain-containing protein [Muribaculaceae bacterium]|nr:leucine-rich repeat domain-containing protein [Muribaculaceae bacterium]